MNTPDASTASTDSDNTCAPLAVIERIERHVGLVPFIVSPVARKWKLSEADTADALGAGYLGLCHAARRFDPNRGSSFSTYACTVIHGWARHAIYSQLRDTKAEQAGVSLVSLNEVRGQSLPYTTGVQTYADWIDRRACPHSAEAFSLVEASTLWKWVEGQLPEELHETMYLYFVLELSYQEIADKLLEGGVNITRQAVFLRVKRALSKLRDSAASDATFRESTLP